MKIKKFIITIILLCLSLLAISCATSNLEPIKDTLTVTLLNGEYYTVVGKNKVNIEVGQSVTFTVNLEHGFEIVDSYGDKCVISQDISFTQTVTFPSVKNKSVTRLETAPIDTNSFTVSLKDESAGIVEIDSVLGLPEENTVYSTDLIDINLKTNDEYRFVCWSVGGFLDDGGVFYSYDNELEKFDFNSINALYANVRKMSDTGNMIFYKMGGGIEIEQDCSAMIEHHPRANTLTANDVRNKGIDCDSRMLVGWETDTGNSVRLGSRMAVNNETAVFLNAVWREYTNPNYFDITENGRISLRDDVDLNEELNEIVIPNQVNSISVKAISSYAFSNSNAAVYYIPDTVTTIEDNAFLNCSDLMELYFSDSIVQINDEAFSGCYNFTTVHINAIEKPRYSDTYYSSKLDVFDRLAHDFENGRKKIVVLGGSSVANGYSGWKTKEVMDAYGIDMDFYNLGLNATHTNLIQSEVAAALLSDGDVFIHAPESAYVTAWCGNFGDSVLTNDQRLTIGGAYNMLTMFESNWQLLENVQVYKYTDLLSSIAKVNAMKLSIEEKDYAAYYPITEDGEGARITGEYVRPECGDSNAFGAAAYAFSNMTDQASFVLENLYTPLYEKGVIVFNTFPPLARQVLLNWYGSEQGYVYAADLYTQRVKGALGSDKVRVLLSHNDTVYDASHFFGHCMHLGYDYQIIHTEKIMTAVAENILNNEAVAVHE